MQRPPAYLTLPSSALVRGTVTNAVSTCNLQPLLHLVFCPPCLALHPRSQPSRNPHLHIHAVQRRGFGTMDGPLLPRAIRWITYACASVSTLALVLAMAGGGGCSYHQLPVRPGHAGARLPQRPCSQARISLEDGQAPVLHASVLLSGTPPSCTPITRTLTP